MDHRSYGKTKNCKGCRYWSEMIAGCDGDGPVKALCLAPQGSPKHGKHMAGFQTCSAWASGHLGAIDEPGQDPRAYDMKFTREDGPEADFFAALERL